MKKAIGLFLILSGQLFAGVETKLEVLGNLSAGEKTTLKFTYLDQESQRPFSKFMTMHEKKMHLIVIHESFKYFAHIHPELNNGEFTIDINKYQNDDPDNGGTVNTLPVGGKYWLFSEAMPMKQGMVISKNEIQVTGKRSRESRPVFTDGRRRIVRYVDKLGNLSLGPSHYKVTFNYEQFDFCDRWMPKFYFQWEELVDGKYVPVSQFARWLGMGGHAILINAENQAFHHLHAFLPMATAGEFTFPYHDHENPLQDGNYMIFGQFKIENQVFKVSFPFSYSNPSTLKCLLN